MASIGLIQLLDGFYSLSRFIRISSATQSFYDYRVVKMHISQKQSYLSTKFEAHSKEEPFKVK